MDTDFSETQAADDLPNNAPNGPNCLLGGVQLDIQCVDYVKGAIELWKLRQSNFMRMAS